MLGTAHSTSSIQDLGMTQVSPNLSKQQEDCLLMLMEFTSNFHILLIYL